MKRGVDESERKTKRRKQTEKNAEKEAVPSCYCVVPGDRRFGSLATFVKKNLKKKIVVIFSTYGSLVFHTEVFSSLGMTNFVIHEKLNDAKVSSTIQDFEKADRGLLLATEDTYYSLVLPPVDWIVHYESPDDVEKYKQHMSGRVLLFLLPQEADFVKENENRLVPCELSDVKTANMQTLMEKVVQKNYRIHQLSMDAYRSYFKACASHSAFREKNVDLKAAAASFGIKCPPKILTV